MDLSKIDYVYHYFDSKRGESDVYIILHALLHCLAEHDIENAYFTYGQQDKSFKATLESFITKRTSENPGVAYLNVAENLLSKLEKEVDFIKRRPYLTFLSKIIGDMPVHIIDRYFSNLINSSRLSDRNYAYQVAPIVWNEEVKKLLVNLFDEYCDTKCLEVLIDKLSPNELLDVVKEPLIWDDNYFYRRVRRSIIRRVAVLDISEFDFIKVHDIDSYLFLLSLKRHQLSGINFKHLVDDLPDDRKMNKIWFFGLLGDWDSIINLIEN